MAALGDEERTRDSAVQRCQNGLVGPGKLCEMPVGSLLWSSDPPGEARDVAVIGNENPANPLAAFHLEQEFARLYHGRAVLLNLPQHTYKAQFGDRTRCQFWNAARAKTFHPTCNPRMKLMLHYNERKQSIHIQQVFHGKSARISRTSALVSLGAFGPAVRTGNPVAGSQTIRPLRGRTFRGVRTICWPSTLASSESPGCSPSLRRILLGTTTCPFVETVVRTVRVSYYKRRSCEQEWWALVDDLRTYSAHSIQT